MKRYILDQALKKSLRSKFLAQGGAYRFRLFQKWLLESDVAPEVAGLSSLFAFDGMRIDDFCCVVKSSPLAYADGKVGIAWIDDIGRTQRVRLSPITIDLIRQCGWNEIIKLPITVFEDIYQGFAGNKEPLENFKRDQMAWFAEISSGPILEHFCGHIPMTALPDSVYARLLTKQALSIENSNDLGTSESIFSVALSGFVEPVGEDKNPLLIDSILGICHRKQVHDKSNHKRWMLEQCSELAISAHEYGPVSSLILSWTIDLITNGTIGKSDISVSTVANYVGVAARYIFSEFKNKEFPDWNSIDFNAVYKKIIQYTSAGQKRNMASALSSWHHFLVNWLDFPQIPSKLHDEVPDCPPHSNVLWEHEYHLVQDWLKGSSIDERISIYLQALFCISYHIRIRINELFKLRLSDIHIFDEKIEIKINGTKTTAAKRIILIDRENLKELEILVERRLSELALNQDYLFGDPNKINRIYKLGFLYAYASQMLKAVTGDRSIKVHTTSHTVISNLAPAMLVGGTNTTTNPLNQFATDAAHFSILTTCSEYTHCYEDSLRATINRDLKHLKITSKIAAKWGRDSECAIRKRTSRGVLDRNEYYWDVIFENVDITDYSLVAGGIEVKEPQPPKFLSALDEVDFLKLLNMFKDLHQKIPLETVSLRQSIPAHQIHHYLQQAKQLILNYRLCDQFNYSTSEEAFIKLIPKLEDYDFKKTEQLKLGELKKWFEKTELTAEIIKCLQSWLSIKKYGYISLSPNHDTRNFLHLISKAGIPSTKLAIAFTPCIDQKFLRELQSIFYEFYGVRVPQFTVESRRGRPNAYLLFSSSRIDSDSFPKSASTSISGLNALLFIALVMTQGNFDDKK